MAPPSPRRSSRARAPNSLSQQSSTASGASGRVDRSTRAAANKSSSSGKSTPSASLSSEPLDDFDEGHLLRRRKRGLDDEGEKTSRLESVEMAHASDEIQEDDEAVRCICGFDDYPGPPPIDHDTKHGKVGQDAGVFAGIELTDEITGFFVQCDVCKVWQHGACVGIMTEESSPEEYFCEQCRKDFHRIHKASNGQRYSTYLPLHRTSQTTSRSASLVKDTVRSPQIGNSKNDRSTAIITTAAAVAAVTIPATTNTITAITTSATTTATAMAAAASSISKRRSTMNSREAAYDEDEQLRRAIEESKELATHHDDPITKRVKRGRSDSEENTTSAKRQRTSSRSSSPSADKTKPDLEDESDDGTITRNGSSKKSRSVRQQKERSEREERERQRLEAAKNRKGRAERRRGEDSDPSEEMPLAARSSSGGKPTAEVQPSIEPPPASSQVAPDTPPPGQTPTGNSHKKSSRSHQKKPKGRNQYTKEDTELSPARSMSRDIARTDQETNGGGNYRTTVTEKSSSKSKSASGTKMSMFEIKRRSAAFLEFIAKTQVEMAIDDTSEDKNDGEGDKSEAEPNGLPRIQINGDGGAESAGDAKRSSESAQAGANGDAKDKNFKELDCFEMMDVLATDLVKWQNKHST